MVEKGAITEMHNALCKRSFGIDPLPPPADVDRPVKCYPESETAEEAEGNHLEIIDICRRTYVSKNKDDLIRAGNFEMDRLMINRKPPPGHDDKPIEKYPDCLPKIGEEESDADSESSSSTSSSDTSESETEDNCDVQELEC